MTLVKNQAPRRRFDRGVGLPVCCYLLAVAVWLLLGLVHCGSDAVARADGRLAAQSVPLEQFQLVDLAPTETGYITTSGDPQIILEDVAGQVIRTISYQVRYPGADPREICLYYTTRPGEAYSADRRVFPVVLADGSYLYTMPRTKLCALRLDICSPDVDTPVEVEFEPAALEFNAAAVMPGLGQYFVPSWYQVFCLIAYPALAAAGINWLAAVVRYLRRKFGKKA